MKDWPDDAEPFEPIRDTSHGDGSSRAANKGKVKRRLKGQGASRGNRKHWKRKRKATG